MANIIGIEVSGDTYNLEDSQARQDIQTNSQDIDGIEGKIPASASSTNKLVANSELSTVSSESITKNGMTVNFKKRNNICYVFLSGMYNGESGITAFRVDGIPQGFIPLFETKSCLIDNSIDTPVGQISVRPEGDVYLYCPNSGFQTGHGYVCSVMTFV